MAQDYTVTQFKKGDFQDQNGNFWCDMALQGVGEPVRIVVKDPLQFHDGMTLYGRIEEVTSKAGKPYNRFYREKKDEAEQQTFSSHAGATKDEYWDDKNATIRAQWAIGQASNWIATAGTKNFSDVEAVAKDYFAMVDRVKGSRDTQISSTHVPQISLGSSESTDPKAQSTTENSKEQSEVTSNQTFSGYDKFKASKPVPKDVDLDADSASLYASIAGSEEIPADGIPF